MTHTHASTAEKLKNHLTLADIDTYTRRVKKKKHQKQQTNQPRLPSGVLRRDTEYGSPVATTAGDEKKRTVRKQDERITGGVGLGGKKGMNVIPAANFDVLESVIPFFFRFFHNLHRLFSNKLRPNDGEVMFGLLRFKPTRTSCRIDSC